MTCPISSFSTTASTSPKGVGCVTRHGRVDLMPLTRRTQSLAMQWCLDYHWAPEKHLRPRDQVFNMQWKGQDQLALGEELKRLYHVVNSARLTDCSICRR